MFTKKLPDGGFRARYRVRPRPITFSPQARLPVTEQRLVLSDRAYRLTVVAIVVVHVVIVRIEVEVPRVVRVVRVERTRPVVPVAACIVEAAIVAVASSGQEEITL